MRKRKTKTLCPRIWSGCKKPSMSTALSMQGSWLRGEILHDELSRIRMLLEEILAVLKKEVKRDGAAMRRQRIRG